MNWKLKFGATTFALLAGASLAHADGELNIFNWGDYTSPELIKKFEEQYKVKVTITDYDSNDTALAKIRAGGHGYDIVVPSSNYVQIFVKEGLLAEARPDQMENFKNVDPRWVDVAWDPGRHYTVPWQIGYSGIGINTKAYSGDINTSAIWLDPPAELVGKINVEPEMNDVLFATIKYFGGEWCTDDKELLKKVRDKLLEAKPKWLAMDYSVTEKLPAGDYQAVYYWNGAILRSRLKNPDIKFGYPKEGFPIFMDSVALLKDAKNPENAKLFMNFIMDPENAALISSFAKYANGIKGSEAFMPADMKGAPEITIPAEFEKAGEFLASCSPETVALYSRIWTDIQK
jgi:spermidine/putrescine transport system substrate-binding protein